jgi:hypothetical protein
MLRPLKLPRCHLFLLVVSSLLASKALAAGIAAAASAPQPAKINPGKAQDVPGDAKTNPHRPDCAGKTGSTGSTIQCSLSFASIASLVGSSFAGEYVNFGSLDFNIPLAKGSESASLGSLDGLARSYTLGATLGWQVLPSTGPMMLWGISVGGGSQVYSWYETPGLGKESDRKSNHALGAFVGRAMGDSTMSYLRLRDETAFKDQKSKTLCPAPGGAAYVECVSGPIGAPTRQHPRILSAQVLRSFSEPGTGFSITLSRDTRNKINGIEVPVYLYAWKDDKGRPSAAFGVVAGWSNDPKSERSTSLALILSTNVFKPLTAK